LLKERLHFVYRPGKGIYDGGDDMKKGRVALWLLVLGVTSIATSALAFNPAAHIYIAERVFPSCADKINLRYGSIAPDLYQYATAGKWATGFDDTHYDYVDLRSCAWGTAQKCFALGWWSHNEDFAADSYAHKWYVYDKAQELSVLLQQANIDFMHFAIETAIDVLLKQDDHSLANKLVEANLLRSPLDKELLTRVLVYRYHRTDWATLASAELAFRGLVGRYATALALPNPLDKLALAALGVQLAQQMYGISSTEAEVLAVLEAAITLCREDYKEAIDYAIDCIRHSLP
jgi:hypothetical protein